MLLTIFNSVVEMCKLSQYVCIFHEGITRKRNMFPQSTFWNCQQQRIGLQMNRHLCTKTCISDWGTLGGFETVMNEFCQSWNSVYIWIVQTQVIQFWCPFIQIEIWTEYWDKVPRPMRICTWQTYWFPPKGSVGSWAIRSRVIWLTLVGLCSVATFFRIAWEYLRAEIWKAWYLSGTKNERHRKIGRQPGSFKFTK